jgi:PAS domain S-box-containing protein
MNNKSDTTKPKLKSRHPQTPTGKSVHGTLKTKTHDEPKSRRKSSHGLRAETEELRARLAEAEETLRAIRGGEVDALVVSQPGGDQVFTLKGVDHAYRVLVEEMNEGAATLNADGVIHYCNNSLASMLKISLEKVIGSSLQRYVSPEFLPAFDQFIKQSLQGSGKAELSLKKETGALLPVLVSGRRLPLDEVRGISIVITDVAAQKETEETLRNAFFEIKKLKEQLQAENRYLLEEVKLLHTHENIVGNSEAIRGVLKQVEQVAGTDATVLIQGETGTGKELLANAIHTLSTRKGRLLVKVNCAALPPTLIESELFGREKGAFTGAHARQMGRFELADGGTLFLDEISEMPLELQTKLLRVLQDGEFERLGSPKTIKVSVRLITATNRDLKEYVREGRFREDLFYRLNVFPLFVPPLRERKEDILPLVWSFVQEFGTRMGKRIESIPRNGIETLQNYGWPGNVRELRNVIERAMIMTTGPVLRIEIPKSIEAKNGRLGTLEEIESRHIIDVLNSTGWHVSGKGGAAEILGLIPKTLESRMKKLGIQRNR